MEQCPLDEEIAVETFESIQAKLEEVQEVLSKRYGLPKVQAQFRNALQRKLAAEEIYDEPDVQLWQSLFGAVLARAKYGAEIIKEPNRVETCPTQAAAGGLSYFLAHLFLVRQHQHQIVLYSLDYKRSLGSFVAPPKAPDEYRAQEYRRYQGYINDLF